MPKKTTIENKFPVIYIRDYYVNMTYFTKKILAVVPAYQNNTCTVGIVEKSSIRNNNPLELS